MTLSVVLITLNEENNIDDCLKSADMADEIIVVDGGSTDATVIRAKKYTDRIYHIPFRDFASQKNEAIARATGDWIFIIDADERITPELKEEILHITGRPGLNAVYSVGRITYFFRKRLRYSGTREDYPIRLFPRTEAKFTQPVHEEIVTKLPLVRMEGKLIHYSTRDFTHYKEKLRRYIPFEILVLKNRGARSSLFDWLIRPWGKVIQIFVLQQGFRDGWTGFCYAVLSGYYTFLKYTRYALSKGKPAAMEEKTTP